MTVIENSVQLERPPEDVFDYLVDMRNELEWNPDVESMEKILDGPIGLGTKFRAKWKQTELVEVECVEFERPLAWRYDGGGPLSASVRATLAPHGAGSLLTVYFDVRAHGKLRLLFPVLLPMLRRSEKKNMSRIKRAVESKV
jgi:carbon monoxide dehydrogenase subunit G